LISDQLGEARLPSARDLQGVVDVDKEITDGVSSYRDGDNATLHVAMSR